MSLSASVQLLEIAKQIQQIKLKNTTNTSRLYLKISIFTEALKRGTKGEFAHIALC
jgi:uncharacterized pyridoxal phosphate-containing UPF0001 family protein